MELEEKRPFVSAVIVAAGASTRMGVNKMLLEIGSMSVIARTLAAFEECDDVDEIILISAEANVEKFRTIVREGLISKVTNIARGGDTRQASVWIGVDLVNKNADYIAVHDGARCLIKPDQISAVIAAAKECGAAAAAVKSKDTVKIVDDNNYIIDTIDRDFAVQAQTPQIFERQLLLDAFRYAYENNFIGTDECTLVEAMGRRIKIVDGGYENIKLTTPEDVAIAREILTRRGKL